MHIAKWLVALVSVWNFGGLVVDTVIPVTAKQHLWNPRWPPHAKFHNCQTMVMGVLLGCLSLGLLFAPGELTFSRLLTASGVAGAYFIAMLFAPLFPGTAWHNSEFANLDPMPLGMSSQMFIAIVICGVLVVACSLAYFTYA